jgi:predicted AlkP superfamily pyrophosphatase or phosphodiesterase
MVTGLRPDRHGVVDNNMVDPMRPGVRFSLGNPTQALDPFWWQDAEPLWVTAEKQGIRSATMFWPGSEVALGGIRPTDWHRYDQNISNAQRIRAVVDWLRRPQATRPRFITLYFDTVDTAGHKHGPEGPETLEALREVDERIGELQAELHELGQPTNLIVVSDHGMAATSSERVIRIDKLMDTRAFKSISDGAFLALEPEAGREKEVEAALLTPHANMQCWRKGSLPARFHYGMHRRVPSVFCLAKSGWRILTKEPSSSSEGGTHGYDNLDPTMMAVFIAAGPAFRSAISLPVFDNIDVYPLLARVLRVTPQPSDGKGDMFRGALRD